MKPRIAFNYHANCGSAINVRLFSLYGKQPEESVHNAHRIYISCLKSVIAWKIFRWTVHDTMRAAKTYGLNIL